MTNVQNMNTESTKNLICNICKHIITNENIIFIDKADPDNIITYENEMIFLQSCDHFFCRQCLVDISLQSFMSGVYVINCPENSCKATFHFDDVIKIINHDVNLYANFVDNYIDPTPTLNNGNDVAVINPKIYDEILPGFIIETTKNDPNCNTVCNICGDTFYINQFHFADKCTHLFCLSCYKEYLKIKINEGETDIKCMAIDCDKLLTYNDIIKIISDDVELTSKYERFLLKKTFEDQVLVTKYKKKIFRKPDGSLVTLGDDGLPLKQKRGKTVQKKRQRISDSDTSDSDDDTNSDNSNDSDYYSYDNETEEENYIEDFEEYVVQTKIIVCPKCSNFMEIDFDERRTKGLVGGHVVRCSNSSCKYLWCSYCKVLHNESTCDTYLQLLKAQNFDEWREIKGDLIRDCPNCNCVIEKNQGCNHMTCQKCKKGFCWVCGYLQMTNTDWSHKKCSGKWGVAYDPNKKSKPPTSTATSTATTTSVTRIQNQTRYSNNIPVGKTSYSDQPSSIIKTTSIPKLSSLESTDTHTINNTLFTLYDDTLQGIKEGVNKVSNVVNNTIDNVINNTIDNIKDLHINITKKNKINNINNTNTNTKSSTINNNFTNSNNSD